MATRMQQRRGTAAQWISTNSGNGPILNAGEIGFETDTNKFKIGDGTNHWINLDYFIDANSTVNPSFGSSITFEGATANAFETTVAVTDPTADRTITFPDATGTVVLADGSGNVTVSGDLTVSGTTTTINSTTINATTGIVFEGATADAFETILTVTDPTADRTITFPDATGTVALTSDIAELSQDAIDSALTAGTGITKTYNDAANTLTVAVDTTTIQARVADVSDTEIGYLNGVTSAIQTQLDDKSTASKTETLTNKSISLGSNTVTSTLAQLNSAVSDADVASLTGTETLTNKTLTSPVINTPTGITKSDVGLANVDNTTDANKPISTATQTALDLKAPLANPTFTGTVSLPANTITNAMISDDAVDTAEIKDSAVTSAKIADGTIVNGDINASAAIDQSKISGLTTNLDLKAPLASPTFTGTVTVPTPTNSTDAATKAYVDAVTEGLHIHASVIAATTANVALSTALENGDTLDGITLATGNRILVKNQTTQSENGIYVVAASGQPTRATDFDTAAEVDSGDFVFVSSGTINGSTGWVQVNRPATIGTDAIAFTQFSGAGTYVAGTGLTLTGNSFSVNHPVASQSGNSGKYLTTDGTNTSWGTVTSYSAPTLGSTSIASGATVTTIAGLTLTAPTLTGTVIASGDINLSVANGPGSLIDELTLLLMGAV